MRHLLAFAPLLDDTNQNAANHIDFIHRTLEYLTTDPPGAVCLIGDSCTTNIAAARLFGVPLLGCSSHRQDPVVLPTAVQVKRLEALRKNELSIFQCVSIELQGGGYRGLRSSHFRRRHRRDSGRRPPSQLDSSHREVCPFRKCAGQYSTLTRGLHPIRWSGSSRLPSGYSVARESVCCLKRWNSYCSCA
ncbi:hypothetical protein JG688_00018067 [Phytophthora aleatoria]|uniref:Uncharacterized protein n=1 Tax=Phytophthora aleatoria TaxID=2496075 RepID=A0A8J5I434_9STRA|nr:hypothetical protein JG688_00018067 [Phytophthora aleatoria]